MPADAILLRNGRERVGAPVGDRLLCELPALASPEFEGELARAMALGPAAVVLPCVECGADLQQLGSRLAVQEAEGGLPDGSTRILTWAAETPKAALILPSLVGASRRLAALIWDGERLAQAAGIRADTSALVSIESQVVLAARACGVPALHHSTDAAGSDPATRFRHLRGRGFGGVILDRSAQAPHLVSLANAIFG